MRRVSTSFIVALSIVALAACTAAPGDDPGASDELIPVTVGTIPILDMAPVYLGVEQGIFEKHGLDVEPVPAQGGAAIVPAVFSGQLDFGFAGVPSILLANERGLDFKIVNSGAWTNEVGDDCCAVVVAGDSEIESAADFGGRTIAVNTLDNLGTVTIRNVAREAGVDPDSISFVEIAFADVPAAISQGTVDAAYAAEPAVTISLQQGAKVASWVHIENDPDLMVSAYFTTGSFAEANPETTSRFAAALNESLEFAAANPELAQEIIATYTTLPPELIAELMLPRWAPEIGLDSIALHARLANLDGLIDTVPDPESLIVAFVD